MNNLSDLTSRPGLLKANWPTALGLVAMILLAQWVFLVFVSPMQLTPDEAHYWEWSRRLSLSYYTKGPGIAWLIAASTSVLGDTVWAVRIPASISIAVAALAVGRLAQACALRPREHWAAEAGRAGFFGIAAFYLISEFQGMALLLTIDPPYVACWAVALWTLWLVDRGMVIRSERVNAKQSLPGAASAGAAATDVRSASTGRTPAGGSRDGVPAWIAWLVMGAVIGLGFLFKYTIVLFLPTVLLYAWFRRDCWQWTLGRRLAVMGAAAATVLTMSPVVVWNHVRGWPTVKHLLGRIALPGGDEPTVSPELLDMTTSQRLAQAFANFAKNVGEYVGSQLGLVGPLMVALMVMALWWALKSRRRLSRKRHRRGALNLREQRAASARLLMLCSAGPIIGFYSAVSLIGPVQGNWPVAGYVSLAALVGAMVSMRMAQWERAVWRWRHQPGRPKMGLLLHRPETVTQILWHNAVAYGLCSGLVLTLGVSLVLVMPATQSWANRAPLNRLNYVDLRVEPVRQVLDRFSSKLNEPMLITSRYQTASLLAFYLPGQPRTFCAHHLLGGRPTAYDFFADTNLTDPSLTGRDAILIGGSAQAWQRTLKFDRIETIQAQEKLLIGYGYRGVVQLKTNSVSQSESQH